VVQDTEYRKSLNSLSPCSNVLFPAPDGAEMRNKIPVRRVLKSEGEVTALLDVLHLFANFLQLGLGLDYPMRGRRVAGFYAHSVEFPADFLS